MIQCYVIMGVSGCGKSSVGAAFATAIGGNFIDGDDLHPAGNRAKMASGQPLDDDDRGPWLVRVGQALSARAGPVVIACSALKLRYRDRVRAHAGKPVIFIHLTGSRQVLAARMATRKGHFMPPSLLDSQLAALEPLTPHEAGISVDIDQTLQDIVAELLRQTRTDHRPQP